MKTALICDWLVTYAGSERVLEAILECFPDADLFAVVDFIPPAERGFLRHKPVTTTFIQKLPGAKKRYRSYLPLMPLAIEQLDLSGYDLILSSSHAVAKGVLTGPDQLHFSYIHSPMRYAWDLQHQYLAESGLTRGLRGMIAKYLLHRLRLWDQRSAQGVDYFMANSHYIARRIQKAYRRPATVIYPPVDVERFTPGSRKEEFYFTASRLVPYKKVSLIVEAFAALPDKKLIVMGDGPEFAKIQKKATPNITLLGHQPTAALIDHLQRAKAFVFAAEEDFGILPVEAAACGTPVIAFGKGGALETIRGLGEENPTGVFFAEQTVASLHDAITAFEKNQDRILPENCVKQAQKFGPAQFKVAFQETVRQKLQSRGA